MKLQWSKMEYWLLLCVPLICMSDNTISFDGSDVFPDGHDCAKCCSKEFKELNINDTMTSCDILSSDEGTSFLLLNPNGTLEIYANDELIWSSCDEYIQINNQCHERIQNSELYLDPNNAGILTLFNSTQPKITWSKGYENTNLNSNPYSLQIDNNGDLQLLTSESNVLWTSNTQFEDKGKWKLIFSHNCTQLAYFTIETSRQMGTIADLIYSDLVSLSESRFQKDNQYLFKMCWPQNINILDLVWKQSTNPSADFAVEAFDSLMDPYQQISWGGLMLSSETYSDRSLINGDTSGSWNLPIAVYSNIITNTNNGCLPGPNDMHKYVDMVQLWVLEYSDVITEQESESQSIGELMIIGFPEEPIIETNDSSLWPVIAIQRILGKNGEVEAFCVTQDDTAVEGEDYIYTRKEFKWFDQETKTQIMQIPIIDDDKFEFDEQFIVHCESPSTKISRNDITIVIKGPNDVINGKVMVLRNDSIIWVNESIGNLTLQLQPTFHESDMTVQYTTHGELDGDYIDISGSMHWKSNDTTIKNLNITIVDDILWEYDACFYFIVYDEHMVHDNVTICIHDNDDPGNCSDINWGNWSQCMTEYGVGQQIRTKNVGIPDVFGTIHCETKIETQTCVGNLSFDKEPNIILSSHVVNISENGLLYDLAQSSQIIVKLTTMPIINTENKTIKFIESDSLVEIVLDSNREVFNFINYEPGYIAFNNMDWSEQKMISFTAIDDDVFTAFEVIVEIKFKIYSVDMRYDNISIQPLLVHVWDDDFVAIKEGKSMTEMMDQRILIAIVCLVVAFYCLCVSYWRAKYIRYKEWKSHHGLHFDQLEQENLSDYSEFDELNLDDPYLS